MIIEFREWLAYQLAVSTNHFDDHHTILTIIVWLIPRVDPNTRKVYDGKH